MDHLPCLKPMSLVLPPSSQATVSWVPLFCLLLFYLVLLFLLILSSLRCDLTYSPGWPGTRLLRPNWPLVSNPVAGIRGGYNAWPSSSCSLKTVLGQMTFLSPWKGLPDLELPALNSPLVFRLENPGGSLASSPECLLIILKLTSSSCPGQLFLYSFLS